MGAILPDRNLPYGRWVQIQIQQRPAGCLPKAPGGLPAGRPAGCQGARWAAARAPGGQPQATGGLPDSLWAEMCTTWAIVWVGVCTSKGCGWGTHQ